MSTTIDHLVPDDWREFRDVRLRALADAPDSFGITLAEAQDLPEEAWRSRLSGGDPILTVRVDGTPVAMGAGWIPPDEEHRMMVWGMWTSPEARGHGHGRSLLGHLPANPATPADSGRSLPPGGRRIPL